jgi:hypothetical protein
MKTNQTAHTAAEARETERSDGRASEAAGAGGGDTDASTSRTAPGRHHLARRDVLRSIGAAAALGVDSGDPFDVAAEQSTVGDAAARRPATRAGTVPMRATRLADGDRARFGAAVALDGATAAVGVLPGRTVDGPDYGAVSIFDRGEGEWSRDARYAAGDLSPVGVADGGQFGASVALSGATLLVGTPISSNRAGDRAGFVTALRRVGHEWRVEATLSSAESTGVDRFGQSVAVDGETALVGAPADAAAGPGVGSVAVFTRSDGRWTRRATLAPEAAQTRRFGTDVAVAGDTAVVGFRRGTGADRSEHGGACVFVRRGGSWWRRATFTGGGRGDRFGESVALDGETVVVGAPGETNAAGPNAGGAYAFGRTGRRWQRSSTLVGDPRRSDDRFGESVAVDDDFAVVGAPLATAGRSPDGGGLGTGYLFERRSGDWRYRTTLSPPGDPVGFGTAVVLDGRAALVAADGRRSPNGTGGGVTAVFEP